MNEPKWTDAVPTEPGYYFWRSDDSEAVEAIRVFTAADQLHGHLPGSRWPQRVGMFGGQWWPVPIAPPGQTGYRWVYQWVAQVVHEHWAADAPLAGEGLGAKLEGSNG